jgi:hypothetical protein
MFDLAGINRLLKGAVGRNIRPTAYGLMIPATVRV